MPKVRVVLSGTVGRSVLIDTDLEPRITALETKVAALSGVSGGAHSALTGLTVGDDHPQYTMYAATENITGVWNFAAEPTILGDLLQEYIQDKIGTILVDSSSVDFTYSDATPSITATVITANPSGLIGMSAVNGTAATPLRSDGLHAIDPAIAPVWAGLHTFANAAGAVISPSSPNLSISENPNLILERSLKVIRTSGANIRGYAYGSTGTLTSPGGARSGDSLLAISGGGYDTSAFSVAASITFSATENWAVGAHGAEFAFSVTPTGSATAFNAMFVRQTGNIEIPRNNSELQIGASQQLREYFDGTNSVIRSDSGDLRLNMAGTDRLSISSTLITATLPLVAPAATTSIPSIRLPHGAAPSAPTNGDMWTTTAGLFVRINGVTVGPLT